MLRKKHKKETRFPIISYRMVQKFCPNHRRVTPGTLLKYVSIFISKDFPDKLLLPLIHRSDGHIPDK